VNKELILCAVYKKRMKNNEKCLIKLNKSTL
jgi:hypothetical protein